jgi:hypothetical protein
MELAVEVNSRSLRNPFKIAFYGETPSEFPQSPGANLSKIWRRMIVDNRFSHFIIVVGFQRRV